MIEKLYDILESKNDFNSYIPTMSLDDIGNDRQYAYWEHMAFLRSAVQMIPKDDQKDDWISYFTKRYNRTKNLFLRARYSYLLYYATRKDVWFTNSINSFQSILNTNKNETNNAYTISKAALYLFYLACENKSSVKKCIQSYIDAYLNTCSWKMQHFIIANSHKPQRLDESKSLNIFEKSNYPKIVEICIKNAKHSKEYCFINSAINEAIYYIAKDRINLKEQEKACYEILGDNEATQLIETDLPDPNIANAHLNQLALTKMIDYYHQAGCVEKENSAKRRYNENKKYLRCIPIKVQNPMQQELVDAIKKRHDAILELKGLSLILYYSIGDELVFPPCKIIDNIKHESSTIEDMMSHRKCDINGNSLPINNIEEWNKFQLFDCSVRNMMRLWYADAFLESVGSKKITFTLIKKFFEKYTKFCMPITHSRNGEDIEYTWFETIDNALKDFINQTKRLIENKPADFRICTDSFAIHFESILRDMLAIQCGSVSKLDPKGKKGFTEMLLDDILRHKSLNEFLTEDDIFLFKYVFTNAWFYNIRNYVAHGFLKPSDYDFGKAFLTFLCILRLAIRSNNIQLCHD